MTELKPNDIVLTTENVPIRVIEEIGQGGQGIVYRVLYQGEEKALKWYFPSSLNNPDAFYINLLNNIKRGLPNDVFLWPEAATQKKYDESTNKVSFGYIMPIRPKEYVELSKVMASPEKYAIATFKQRIEACIQITAAFRILHNSGYSYQDLNDGNFFINIKNGSVLICDNDNVAPNGTTTGIMGKPEYMAPEIVVGQGSVLPNQKSDLYSLALILYIIIFNSHPLKGKRWIRQTVESDAFCYCLFGSQPVFVFDPINTDNRPDPKFQKGVIDIWNCLPKYMKDTFVNAFSQDSLMNPAKRMRELDWMNALTRFRSDVVRCTCGNDTFLQNASTTKCDRCGRPVIIHNQIKLPKYTMAAVKGTRVYRCQLGMCNADEALTPIGAIVSNPSNPSVLGYMNLLNRILKVTTPSGKNKQVQPQGIVPLKKGIIIEAFDKKIEFI